MLHGSCAAGSRGSSRVYVVLVAAIVAAISASGWAAGQEDATLGEQLVREFWEAIRTQDADALDAILAPGFQSVHQDGARNRDEELALCAALEISEYTLTDFVTTRQGATIVVIFMASVEETLAGTRTTTAPAARMAVFLMTEDGWRLVAYANLEPIGAS
jgi:hypothetical protein